MVGPMRGDNTGAAIAIVMGVCFTVLALFVMGFLGYLIGGFVGVALVFIALGTMLRIIYDLKLFLDSMDEMARD